MKHAFAFLIIPFALAGSALAQRPMHPPEPPEDGVGIDYSKPWLNDLLLRMQPWVSGDSIADDPRLTDCTKQLNALSEDPLDPALDQAYDACIAKRVREREALRGPTSPFQRGPNIRPRPFDPADNPFSVMPVPPAAGHPNVQN